MAIVTTDGRTAYNGVMINPENTLNSAQAVANETKFISDFENYVQVGVRGSSNETGLKTADSFLSLSQYASFLRPEAYLIIVVLSDEEDKSPLTVAQYTEKFQSLKANPGMVKVYSIVNTEAIDQEVESIDVGRRYMIVSTATGGVISNIHDNFYQILSLMGERIVNLTNSFALSKIPSSADSIVVYVNGNKMVSGWQYDAISHAIKFEANSIPEEGAQITIEYLTVQ